MQDKERVERIAQSCHEKAMNFTSERQAQKFIKIIQTYL